MRSKALDALDALPDDDGSGVDPAFVFGLVVSHENQHDETMLQALSMRTGPPILGPGGRCRRAAPESRVRRCWCRADRSSWA